MRDRPLEHDGNATLEETLLAFSVEELKSLARLVAKRSPPRKAEIVRLLTREMTGPGIKRFWEELDETERLAVSESLHTWGGSYEGERFLAKYGRSPAWGTLSPRQRDPKPSSLWLLLPDGSIPEALQPVLQEFVPPPPAHQVETVAEVPEAVAGEEDGEQQLPLSTRQTDGEALHDLAACLRLLATTRITASAKTGRVAAKDMKAIRAVLHGGDFFPAADDNDAPGPIKAFAWPLILQAARLARISGTRLGLTPKGKKALESMPEATLRHAWEAWIRSKSLDEFNRVEAIKGQSGKGKRWMTAVRERREAIIDVLAQCPVGRWIPIEAFFRFLRAAGEDFNVTRNAWKLYLFHAHYGSLGYHGYHDWEILQGRYCLTFLFEYAATLGIIDVAYTRPHDARSDYRSQWGGEELDYLSRYDGLRFIRINPFGAWCLGLADTYVPAVLEQKPAFRILPNRDLVASAGALPSHEVHLLEPFAERTGDFVWKLDEDRILKAVEKGHSVTDFRTFLRSRAVEALPEVVGQWLDEVEARTRALAHRGSALLVGCADGAVADLIASDGRMQSLCLRAGPKILAVPAASATAFRRRLRELGYCLPPGGGRLEQRQRSAAREEPTA